MWSEVRAHFDSERTFEAVTANLGLQFVPLSEEAARLAGSHWREYHRCRSRSLRNADECKRAMADFLVGAHAQVQTDVLLARDRGFFRGYFPHLRLMQP